MRVLIVTNSKLTSQELKTLAFCMVPVSDGSTINTMTADTLQAFDACQQFRPNKILYMGDEEDCNTLRQQLSATEVQEGLTVRLVELAHGGFARNLILYAPHYLAQAQPSYDEDSDPDEAEEPDVPPHCMFQPIAPDDRPDDVIMEEASFAYKLINLITEDHGRRGTRRLEE